jgi:hypothetical protein
LKLPLLSTALFVGLASSLTANAVIVTATQNINTFLTSPATSGHTENVVFDDGAGDSVTLQFTISDATNANFTNLDSGVHVGVTGGAQGNNHVDPTEDVTFSVAYLSGTGAVDPNSIGFRFDSIGFRSFAQSNLTWQVNGGSLLTIPTPSAATEKFYTLDTAFTTIGTGAGNYSGVFHNSYQYGQFTTNDTGAGITGKGLQFSVNFAVVPEPSALLALIGGTGVLVGPTKWWAETTTFD